MNALVPHAPPRPRAGAANINVMQSAGDGIAADIRAVRMDSRTVLYVVRVASTASQLTARLSGVARNGEPVDLGGLSVAPASIGSARLAVPHRCAQECQSIYLEIRTDTSLMRLEAPRPPAPMRNKAAFYFTTGVAVMTVAVCALLFNSGRPQPAPLVAAPAIPARAAAAVPVPQIVSLSVRRDRGPDGDSVLASYLAVGDGGNFALLGPGGKVVATTPFTRLGTSRLTIPRPYRELPLFARLTVRRDAKIAFASVALAPLPHATMPLSPAKPLSSAFLANLMSVEGPAIAGNSLELRIDEDLRSPHIELQDESGNTLATRDLAPGTTRIAIPLPATTASRIYYVVLRYMRSGSEETVVRSVVASSRS